MSVTFTGPLTKEEKVSWQRWTAVREELRKEIKRVKDIKRREKDTQRMARFCERADELLLLVDRALGGARDVMGVLEGLDRSTIEQAMRFKLSRRIELNQSVFKEVMLALRARSGETC